MNPTLEERRSLWFLMPVVLLGGLLTMLFVLMGIATHDDGFAVEPDYYRKASAWDQAVQARVRSERLGWTSRASLLAVRGGSRLSIELRDRSGEPVADAHVAAEAFPNARAGQMEHVVLTEVAEGRYEATLPSRRPGLWEVRVAVIGSQGERYLSTTRLDRVEGGQ